ncbi:hypothetical protein ACHAXN_008388 [Cyclotella atomus]
MLGPLLLLLAAPISVSAFLQPPTSQTKSHHVTSTSTSVLKSHNNIHRDILIIGSGLAGLSIAHHIATSDTKRHITILERESPTQQHKKTTAGSFAAAGMLAPQSERMPSGPYLDLCLASREMYGEFVRSVEGGAKEALEGGDGEWLWDLVNDSHHFKDTRDGSKTTSRNSSSRNKLKPWETGFHSTGGFLAPAFAGDAVATWSPQPHSGTAYWLDDIQIRELEPLLHPNVIGGWWFPEDASVDARRLTCALRAACVGLGVDILSGEQYAVNSLEMSAGKCTGVHLSNGRVYSANVVVVANGSWMKNLLPVPIVPHKGQSFSLRMPENQPPLLNRVLFAQDTYIVPKADGRIIVGATVEPGRFDGDVTPEGMLHCLHEATRLCPSLKELPIEETWAGLRPTTPDKSPILGSTLFENVFVAGGYWRNGVLLAPKTGQLVGDLIVHDGDVSKLSTEDAALLNAFRWDRFTQEGGGAKLAANARYASSLYPVHKRSSTGVSSAVGTELGFYEGASAARGDREQDRQSMFGLSEVEDGRLEKAARMGVSDAGAFDFSSVNINAWMDEDFGESENDGEEKSVAVAAADDNDVLTASSVNEDLQSIKEQSTADNEEALDATPVDMSNLSSIYEQIMANKAKSAESLEMGQDTTEQKPDFPFRIYHVDKKTREATMVPPYTQPGEFMRMKEEGKLKPTDEFQGAEEEGSDSRSISAAQSIESKDSSQTTTYDGYSAIREAYGEGSSEEETAAATRAARMRNRVKTSEIDESAIGVMSFEASKSADDYNDSTVESKAPLLIETNTESPIKPIVINGVSNGQTKSTILSSTVTDDDASNETTFDGYTAIQEANSSESREDELEKMRAMRMKNRIKSSDLESLF